MNATLTMEANMPSRLDEVEAEAAQLVDREGFLVFTGTQPFDAVEVIMIDKADREEFLTPQRVQ
ncbi:hypothetical protein [Prosthecobacter sp.]|uniref:hypothetical protein n=1 Tax=Prosthecobacter sp. TaxID=1965333 RepID=UPI003782DCFB